MLAAAFRSAAPHLASSLLLSVRPVVTSVTIAADGVGDERLRRGVGERRVDAIDALGSGLGLGLAPGRRHLVGGLGERGVTLGGVGAAAADELAPGAEDGLAVARSRP